MDLLPDHRSCLMIGVSLTSILNFNPTLMSVCASKNQSKLKQAPTLQSLKAHLFWFCYRDNLLANMCQLFKQTHYRVNSKKSWAHRACSLAVCETATTWNRAAQSLKLSTYITLILLKRNLSFFSKLRTRRSKWNVCWSFSCVPDHRTLSGWLKCQT